MTETARPVTISDLEEPVRTIHGLAVALHAPSRARIAHDLDEAETREALSILAGTVAERRPL